VHDAAAEPVLVQKLEPDGHAIRQRALAAPDDDRVEEQMAFVDQPCRHRLAGQFRAADADVVRRGLLELPDRRGIETALIRVRVLGGVPSVREYTIFSAARQISVKSRMAAG
jgi:hypothetical protein